MTVEIAGRSRGGPLWMLGLVFAGWIGLRMIFWQTPFPVPGEGMVEQVLARSLARAGAIIPLPKTIGHLDGGDRAQVQELSATPAARLRTSVKKLPKLPSFGLSPLSVDLAVTDGHTQPPALPPSLSNEMPLPGPGFSRANLSARWSGDAWLLWRNGGSGPIGTSVPSYGRSQAGAVLRYQLAPGSHHRPFVYVRATRALAGPAESEVSAGLAARPIAGLPISVAGELRLSDEPAGRELRPAAYAVTELPPLHFPAGFRAEAYAQAGYVGGRFATAFVDGQARLDRALAAFSERSDLRLGVGMWGGAQKGAGRLDLGPSARLDLHLGQALSRIAFDYRVRVAGSARPKSGPALTISAGF